MSTPEIVAITSIESLGLVIDVDVIGIATQGPQGEQGDKGDKGDKGDDGSLTPDDVATLEQYASDAAQSASAARDSETSAASNADAAAQSAAQAHDDASAAHEDASATASNASSAQASAEAAQASMVTADARASAADASARAADQSASAAASAAATVNPEALVPIDGSRSMSGALKTPGLELVGTGTRITGDFSNATPSKRVTFQTSIADSATSVGAQPTTQPSVRASRRTVAAANRHTLFKWRLAGPH
jgi:hypothetical protein